MQYFRKYSPYSECAQLFNQWLWKLFCTVIGKYNIMIQNMLASNAKSSNLIFFKYTVHFLQTFLALLRT